MSVYQPNLWEEPVQLVNNRPVLLDVQKDLLERGRLPYVDGAKRVIWQAGCGAGKTVVAGEQTSRALNGNKKVLHIVHRRRLVDQMIWTLEKFGINANPIMEGRKQHYSLVNCASRDTLLAMLKVGSPLPKADLIIWDEAHVRSRELQKWYLENQPQAYWTGYTATPVNADGSSMDPPYQSLVCMAPTSELLRIKRLCPVKVFDPKMVGKARKRGDKVKPVGDPVAHWLKYANGSPTVVFAAKVEDSKDIVRRYLEAGVAAEHIDASTPEDERDDVFERSRSGQTKIISNVGVMVEGVDLPWLVCCQLLRGCNSFILWVQACLDMQTEVLTRSGWKHHDEMTDADEVATFDIETDAIEWCKPEDRFVRPLARVERFYAIKSPHLDIRVTNNHTMVYRCSGETAVNWHRKSAEDLAAMGSQKRIPVSGNEEVDGLPITDAEIRFLGWFLTDGTLDRSNDAIRIYQSSASPFVDQIHQCLQDCGFKYKVTEKSRVGQWERHASGLRFQVSKGQPRGTGKHLRGWSALEPWINKKMGDAYEPISQRQLLVLLDAMNAGDGAKQKNVSWKQKTWHIGTGSIELADRLQSLCIRRGLRCNLSTQDRTHRDFGRNSYHVLHVCLKSSAVIGSQSSEPGRSRLDVSPHEPGELVWCMTTKFGTLITRRNGKVAIVGNCGRVMRFFEGKEFGVILDHSGAVYDFGPPDTDYTWTLDDENANTRANKLPKERKPTACAACGFVFMAKPACPNCGRVLPKKRRKSLLDGIRPGDGVLTEYAGEQAAAIGTETMERLWTKLLNMGRAKGWTMGRVAAIFSKEAKTPPWSAGMSVPIPYGKDGWAQSAKDWITSQKDQP